jgi:hypothetical protein
MAEPIDMGPFLERRPDPVADRAVAELEALRSAWQRAGELARGRFFADLTAGWLEHGPELLKGGGDDAAT